MSAPFWRKPLCWAGLCETFKQMSNETHLWGQCAICGKQAGIVSREALRRIVDAEGRAEDFKRARQALQEDAR